MDYQPTPEELTFLQNYNPGEYPRPSVTADIVIFTINEKDELQVLLIKRGDYPYRNRWALPGGFLQANQESVDQTAARELQEETGIEGAYLKQLYTFSEPDRDPRMHVISTAYTALIPKHALRFKAGDDASDAKLFSVAYDGTTLVLIHGNVMLSEESLAFDHRKIIKMAIDRLRGRLDYTPDAIELLEDKSCFSIGELRKVFEAILGKNLDPANFQRQFRRTYLNTGLVEKLDETRTTRGKRTALFKFKEA